MFQSSYFQLKDHLLPVLHSHSLVQYPGLRVLVTTLQSHRVPYLHTAVLLMVPVVRWADTKTVEMTILQTAPHLYLELQIVQVQTGECSA